MNHTARVLTVLVSSMLGVGASATAGNVQDATRDVGSQDYHAVFPEDIPMGRDWDKTNPTKRQDGVYKPGKQENGVWHWDFVPKDDNTIHKQSGNKEESDGVRTAKPIVDTDTQDARLTTSL